MMNLQTNYMGLKLKSPIVVSACPLSEKVENIIKMEDKGAGAVTLFSLFEEQINQETAIYDSIYEGTSNSFPEALNYFPDLEDYRVGPDQYLNLIRQAKERVDIPIIASLNGVTDEGWINYAQLIEDAGADAIEVNVFHIPADLVWDGRTVEQTYLNIVDRVKASVSVPVAIKLNPYFSAMGNMAFELEKAGADGLVLFNRFYQPDFDIYEFSVVPSLKLSTPSEIRLPLLWISVLYGNLDTSLAATTGIHSASEVIKYILAGADITMTASALLKNGIEYLTQLNKGLEDWMTRMEFDSIHAFQGIMSQKYVSDPSAFERANYIKILEGYPSS